MDLDITKILSEQKSLELTELLLQNDKNILDNVSSQIEKYSDADGALIAVGGFRAGETATDMGFQEFAYKLLHPYTQPVVNFSISPATTLYDIAADNISTITLTVDVTKKSNDITEIKFYCGETVIDTPADVVAGGTFTYTYTPDAPIKASTVWKVEVNDGESIVVKTITTSFIGKNYYGVLSNTVTAPTDADILALTGSLKNNKAFTYNNINLTFEKICYAYPKSFGALTSIKDANNFQYINSYTRSEVTINGIPYYCYLLNTASTASLFTQTFT